MCSVRRECLAWRFKARMSAGWCLVYLRVSASVFCKARMSGVAFCAQEVIVDVLRLSVVFSRRYFIYLLGLRQ